MTNIFKFWIITFSALNVLGQIQQPCSIPSPNDINSVGNNRRGKGIGSNVDEFRLQMFRKVALGSKKSIVMSPYGVWSVLVLAYIGSDGRTKQQLAKVLHLGLNQLGAVSELNDLRSILEGRGRNPPTTLKIKDTAYFSKDTNINMCLSKSVPNIQSVDFNDAIRTAGLINSDVAKATEGKITDVISPRDLSGVKFILLNSIYFKGKWKTPFESDRTTRFYFEDERGRREGDVDLMILREQFFRYMGSKRLGAHVLEIPYEGNEVSLYLLLPEKSKYDMAHVLKSLSQRNFERVDSLMRMTPMDIAIPKFKITTLLKDDLKQVLVEQGLRDVFFGGGNFSRFGSDVPLVIDTINHKAVVEMNEEGTVAAAATLLIGIRSGPPKPLYYVCNRPFIFLIRHKPTRTTLFAGVIRSAGDLESLR